MPLYKNLVTKAKSALTAEEQRLVSKQEEKAQMQGYDEKMRALDADLAITELFNELSWDLDRVLKVYNEKNGQMACPLSAANDWKTFLKSGLGLRAKHIGEVTQEQVEQNKSYQRFIKKLEDHGLEAEITNISGSNGKELLKSKIYTGVATPLTIGCLTSGIPPLMALGLVFGAASARGIFGVYAAGAELNLRIKEKQPLLFLEDMRTQAEKDAYEQSQMGDLLQQINEKYGDSKVAVSVTGKSTAPARTPIQ